MTHDQYVETVKGWSKKCGKADYLRFLNGERLTRAEACKAMCYSCVGGEDTEPCTNKRCPQFDYCQWNSK